MPKRSAEGPPASEEPASQKGRPYEPEREFKQQDAASSSGTSSSVSSSASVLEVDVSKAVVTPDLVRRASMSILSSIGASRSKPLAALSAEEEQDLRRFYLHLMRRPGFTQCAPLPALLRPARPNHWFLAAGLGRTLLPQPGTILRNPPGCCPRAGPSLRRTLAALATPEQCCAVWTAGRSESAKGGAR